MNDVLEISYRVNRLRLILMALAFGASATALFYFAVTNDRGLILYHIITLSMVEATLFYWAIGAVSGWLTIMSVTALATGVASRDHKISLTTAELTAPKGFFFRRPVTLPLLAIRKMRVHSANGTQYINLKTLYGRVNISRRDIGADAFEKLCTALDSLLRAGRPAF